MSLQDILKKILDQAQAQVKEIEKETAEKKASLVAASSDIESKDLSDLEARTKGAFGSVDTKAQSMARRDTAKMLGGVKKDLVEKSLAALIVHLNGLGDEAYKKFISALLSQVDEKDGVLEIPKGKKSLYDTSIELKEVDSVSGGFIFRNKTVTIDNTFESLVYSQFRSQLEIYFAEQLKLV